jgi:hypothetical protein
MGGFEKPVDNFNMNYKYIASKSHHDEIIVSHIREKAPIIIHYLNMGEFGSALESIVQLRTSKVAETDVISYFRQHNPEFFDVENGVWAQFETWRNNLEVDLGLW